MFILFKYEIKKIQNKLIKDVYSKKSLKARNDHDIHAHNECVYTSAFTLDRKILIIVMIK